jgi:hypothetical protein
MFKMYLTGLILCCAVSAAAQTTYDSSALVDTNNTSNSTSSVTTNNTNTVNSTNTNNNVMSGTVTNTNNNISSGSLTYNNNNVNSGTLNYNNTNTNSNTNHNINSGTQTFNNNNVTSSSATTSSTAATVNQNINSGSMTNTNVNQNDTIQRVIQAPPTTVAPAMMSGGNSDLCTTGTSGAIQTQLFGASAGGTIQDENCERLKLSKTLFDMGMKVAAVATMCQDRRVWDAMISAGTPCPIDGKIGQEAKSLWESQPQRIPREIKAKNDDVYKKIGLGSILGIAAYKLFGF